MPTSTHRVCTLCEATCGITVTTDGPRVLRVVGDREDPFSRGHICPKAHGLIDLQQDPDRLRRPLVKRDGRLVEVDWEEAYRVALAGLTRLRDQHGPDTIALYLGNPCAHNFDVLIYGPVLSRALGTKQRYSASSLDQLPKMVSSALLYGAPLTIPVPDLDRSDYVLMLGANPRASNGSLMTAPAIGRRLDALLERGGKLVVVDPRRSETAAKASEHLPIRPGTDAAFLLSLAQVLFAEGRLALGRLEPLVEGLPALAELVAPFTPEATAAFTGIDAADTRRVARELSSAARAVCYGRLGTTCQRFGTLSSWAIDVVDILTGNLDRPGGAMFARAAAQPGGSRLRRASSGAAARIGQRRTRVRALPQVFAEFPAVALADEILAEESLGEGQGRIRGLVTIAGNPALSVPSAARMDRALAALDFMVCVDPYLNETTRHADVILPPPTPLEREAYDLALYRLSIRNVAKWSPAALPRPEGQPAEWEILGTLAKGLFGMADASLGALDDLVLAQLAQGELGEVGGPEARWPDLGVEEALGALTGPPGPARALDLLLRTGAWGDGFGRNPEGLSLQRLREAVHGVDLGPLQTELPDRLETEDMRIHLVAPLIREEIARLGAALGEPPAELVLIGRRHLRSNNSWLHNAPSLVKGKPRCTLLMHPSDAAARGLSSGQRVRLGSAAGTTQVALEVSDEVRPGVVCLPHGWGHDVEGVRLRVASAHAGSNANLVCDATLVDAPSGNAALNGVPVTVAAL